MPGPVEDQSFSAALSTHRLKRGDEHRARLPCLDLKREAATGIFGIPHSILHLAIIAQRVLLPTTRDSIQSLPGT